MKNKSAYTCVQQTPHPPKAAPLFRRGRTLHFLPLTNNVYANTDH